MEISRLLAVVSIGMVGLCAFIVLLLKPRLKSNKAKGYCDLACSLLVFIAVVLIAVAQIKYMQQSSYAESNNNITGIIQIGAHTGEEAEQHSKLVKNNMIWIEAQPEKYKLLKDHVSKFGQEAINALIWNKSGETRDFYITNNSVSSSILEPQKKCIEVFGDAVKVKKVLQLTTITYDDLIKKYPQLADKKYNFLLLDCQGAEYEVLLSIGEQNIQQFKKIEVEISNSELYDSQKQQPEITKLLRKWGYKCIDNCDNTSLHGIANYIKIQN